MSSLMADPVDDPSAAQRTPLSRDRVLAAAIAIADEEGIDALTMRRLARSLGVEAMSIYYHAANKDAILDGILGLVVAEIELADLRLGWKAAIRASAVSMHAVLRRHPWASALLMSPLRVSAGRIAQMEGLLAALADGGFSGGLADRAYHALDAHILGCAMWEAGYEAGFRAAPPDFAATFSRNLDAGRYPRLVGHIAYHLEPPDDGPSAFEFGLDLLLDGLEQAARPG
jgi:AcrR family transcriptional regulator